MPRASPPEPEVVASSQREREEDAQEGWPVLVLVTEGQFGTRVVGLYAEDSAADLACRFVRGLGHVQLQDLRCV
eukprot:14289858-Alexandrium_andersonii.AAC.1